MLLLRFVELGAVDIGRWGLDGVVEDLLGNALPAILD